MRCLETALGLALLAMGATAWSPSCTPCTCYLSTTGLRVALCNNTALTSLPAFPVDTQYIGIQGANNISSLQGGEFDGNTNLTHISLKYNPLTELPTSIFFKTVNLIEIILEYNKLKILQSHLFSNLIYLQKVWLYGNQISVLEDNCFLNVPRLNIIYLGGNRLSKINKTFIDDYSNLKELHFNGNPVYCEDDICELMNRVVQRKLYGEEVWMPRCAGPPSVQGKTWAEAVGALWGAGPERCPRRVDPKLQLLVAELNKTNNEVGRVLQEQKQLKGAVDVLVALFKTETNETRSELRGVKEELHSGHLALKREVLVLQEQTKQALQGKEAANILFKEVYQRRRGAQGLLLLRYSVLPGPDTTQPPT